jgi:alpha-L-rhamnosidase
LIGYYLGRDRQLQRNAVETLAWSIMENGLTQSRYPSRQTQVIPPFSLWWVMMLADQWLYDDIEQPTSRLRQAWEVCLEAYQGDFWQFGDWEPKWGWGVPPNGRKSTMHWLLGQLASHTAWSLMHGENPLTAPPLKIAKNTLEMLNRSRLDGLASFKGDPPTEHSEALRRLLQMATGDPVSPWPTEELAQAEAARCAYYFSYYKHLAMSEIDYVRELEPWREQIENGLTTFAENPEPTRSDCHAWSAHPILGFFQIVAGVTSIERAWAKAEIRPRPGSMRRFDACIAHPRGDLRVALEDGTLAVDSPIPFRLVWEGKSAEYPAGMHRF